MADCVGRRDRKKKNRKSEEYAISNDKSIEFDDKDILKFLVAAQSNDVETLKLYLEGGMPVDTECLMFSETALIKACRTGSAEAAILLLEWKANIGALADDGNMALHIAVKNKQPKIIKLLISHGALLDAKAFSNGTTPLMLAASISDTTIVSLLITMGGNLDLQDTNGKCALHHCFSYYQERSEFALRSVDCAKLLVNAGANILLMDSTGCNPLMTAMLKGNMKGVKYLLTQNCDPDNGTEHCANSYRFQNLLWMAGSRCEGMFLTFFTPRTLKDTCRIAVRHALRACGGVGPKFWSKVAVLPIPESLKDFISLRDVADLNVD